MPNTTIDPNLLLSSLTRESPVKNNKTLGQDAFLKILMAQLQNQDPLNPMKDTEFISQLANFSSLEQMIGIRESVNRLLDSQNDMYLLTYNQLLGKSGVAQNRR